MRAYVFTSSASPGLTALTEDPTGASLPTEIEPWVRENNGTPIQIGDLNDRVAQAIKRTGYYLLMEEPR
jgi:hypothetical protein